MKDLDRKDLIERMNPSSRNFTGAIHEAKSIFEWRYDLSAFFEEITGHVPYPYQSKFLKIMENLNNRYAIVSAGRGTGKTECLAVLALWYVYVLPLTSPGTPMKVVILAGSEKQARICYGYIMAFISKVPFLQQALAQDPTKEEILFIDGSWIRPLTASEKSVRGPHPDLLIVDEACQADDDLLIAAMPMIGTSAWPRLILSSTPDKFFSLFVNIYSKDKDFPQFKRFNWSAEDCPIVSKGFLKNQEKLIDKGNYMIEYLGIPYSFAGKVFPLDKLKECVKHRGLVESDGAKYAGVDWGHYPAPTVITIVERLESKTGELSWKVLHAEDYLKQNFEHVLDQVELIARSYKVSSIYTDSNDIGENQRLSARGLPVLPVKFKSQKSAMISNLRALVENELIQIDGQKDYPLVAQMRDYRYDSKKGDDYVDSLMLAVKGAKSFMPLKWNLKDFIIIKKRKGSSLGSPLDIKHRMDSRYVKPEEIVTKEEKDLWAKIRKEKENK